MTLHAASLAEYLEHVLVQGPAASKKCDDWTSNIWSDDPCSVAAPALRQSPDTALADFARSLADNYWIADLRARIPGTGFPLAGSGWMFEGAEPPDIMRHGDALIFAVRRTPKPPSALRRLFQRIGHRGSSD